MTKYLTDRVAEMQIIDKEFPYPHEEYGSWKNMTHEKSIQKIRHYCARFASGCSIENSRFEQSSRKAGAVGKALWALGLTALTSYMVTKFRELGDFTQIITPLVTLFTAYQLKLNLFGRHIFTGARTYYKAPYFSIADELRLANGWKRIAQLQREGKISVGTGEVKTEDCYSLLGRDHGGGP